MIFGYPIREVDEYGLVEMREVSFVLQPSALRQVADFLNDAASKLEAAADSPGWHRHIDTFDASWKTEHPNLDIVVSTPFDDSSS